MTGSSGSLRGVLGELALFAGTRATGVRAVLRAIRRLFLRQVTRTRRAFATAAEWVARLGEAHHLGRLHQELTRLGRVPLLVIDEVGYIPFDGEAANLFFQLISARYERASVIVTSNKPFGRWGEVFGDPVVAAAMIDRLVHHAEVVNLKGDSYRLKDRDMGRMTTNEEN
jgi:DNA replication protein DnaC